MPRISSILRWAAGIVGGIYILVFLVLAGIRMGYPYELEWVEGSLIDQSLRILKGLPFYSPPTLAFIPSSYTPFFFYVSAAVMRITGAGFWPARLVSILAALGTLFLIYRLVNGSTKYALPGLIAAGLYAAAYRFSGAWMDLARVDSLFLFLVLLGFFIQTRVTRKGCWIFSALCYILAYYTKQSALPVVLVVAAMSLACTWGRSWRLWALTFGLGLAIFFVWNWASGGWFSFYTLDTITYHAAAADKLFFFRQFLSGFYPALAAVSAIGIGAGVGLKRQQVERVSPGLQNLSLSAGLALASVLVFLKIWTYDNGFMPACLGISLLAGWGLAWIARQKWLSHSSRNLFSAGASLLILGQFLALVYNPIQQLPTPQDRAAGNEFIHWLSSLEGQVLVYNHGYYSTLAGKAPFFSSTALGDVTGGVITSSSADYLWRRKMAEELASQILQSRSIDVVIVDNNPAGWQPYYLTASANVISSDAFYTLTGARTRPQFLLIPNPVAEGGVFPLGSLKYRFLFTPSQSFDSDSAWLITQEPDSLSIALSPKYGYNLEMKAQPVCSNGSLVPSLQVDASWDNHSLGVLSFNSCAPQQFSLELPASLVTGTMQALTLTVQPASSPAGSPSSPGSVLSASLNSTGSISSPISLDYLKRLTADT